MVNNSNLENTSSEPKFRSGHPFDLVITNEVDNLVLYTINVLSDYRTITLQISAECVRIDNKIIQFRKMKSESSDHFLSEEDDNFQSNYLDHPYLGYYPCVEYASEYFRIRTQ